jgi:hypothetical protein
MCPVKIQLECEERMTTPIDRLDHIEQSLVRMRPTMAYEVHGAAAIRQELAALREAFAGLYGVKDDLIEFAQEVRRSGDTRLGPMAIAVLARCQAREEKASAPSDPCR